MNKISFSDDDPATSELLESIETYQPEQLKKLLLEEHQRCLVLEKDLFKSQAEKRKLDLQYKALQELNTMNAKNRNNTSSAFTLPSEFKQAWDELVTELIIDAFSNIDQYQEVIPLVQELFILIREEIISIQRNIILDVAKRMNLITDKSDQQTQEQVIGYLDQKFQSIFQEYSLKVFTLSDKEIDAFLQEKYKPRCEDIVSQRDGALEEFEDNISTNDFKRFFRAVLKLQLHMVLNDPPIQLSMDGWEVLKSKTSMIERYDFWMYNKNDYYCIDGFPQEGFPCVVVLPPPYRQGYVYQGIKPAILPVDSSTDEILEHVRIKQEDLVEKLKAKRQLSLCTGEETEQTLETNEQEEEQQNQKQESLETSSEKQKQDLEKSQTQQSLKNSLLQDQQPLNIVNLNVSGNQLNKSKMSQQSKQNSNQQSAQKENECQQQTVKQKPQLQLQEDDLVLALDTLQQEIMQIQNLKTSNSRSSSNLSINKQSSQKKQLASSRNCNPQTDRKINNQSVASSSRKSSTNKYSKYCCLSPTRLKSPIQCQLLQKSQMSKSTVGKVQSQKTNKENQMTLQDRDSVAISQFNQNPTSNNTSIHQSAKDLTRVDEKFEAQVKSPQQLKEKLQTLYTEYMNVKNKTSQIFSNTNKPNHQQIFEDQSALVESARRRLSNNNYGQSSKNNLESRNNNGNNLSMSQSQIFESKEVKSGNHSKQLSIESQTKQTIQSQIKKLAETMRGQLDKTKNKSSYINQQDQTKSTFGSSYYNKTNQNIKSSINDFSSKNYEMPKKMTVNDNIKKIPASNKYNNNNHRIGNINTSNNSSSIIAEMHYQNGMSSVKEDLLRKIQNYQSILKKSQAEKAQKGSTSGAIKANQFKSPFDYSKFMTLESDAKYPPKPSHFDEGNTARSNKKIENINSLKQNFQSKIQQLNQQNETLKHQQRLSSRSKSPIQPNLPRQHSGSNSYKILGGGNTGYTNQSRKSTVKQTYEDFSSSSDSDSDLNLREKISSTIISDNDKFSNKMIHNSNSTSFRQNTIQTKQELTQSVKEFKRIKKGDGVNFKSLTRENNSNVNQTVEDRRQSYRRDDSHEMVSSPKPCVTYRGGNSQLSKGNNHYGLSGNGSSVFSSGVYTRLKS